MDETTGSAGPSLRAAAAAAASPSRQAAGEPPPLHELQRQQQSQPPRAQAQQQGHAPRTGQPGSPVPPSVPHACPPFGSKSVIGRRAKMEDACVAVPFLVEVPVSRAGMDELLPPRIAPQLRSISAGSGQSEQTAANAVAAVASTSAGSAPGASTGSAGVSSGEVGTAMSVDPAPSSREHIEATATETLHFFGVFDGHGGADAALHCAKSLHERVREVLSACAVGPDLLTLRSKDGGGSGGSGPSASAAAGSPRAGRRLADMPQASSSSGMGQPQGSSSSSGQDDAPSSRLQQAVSTSGTEYQDAAETGKGREGRGGLLDWCGAPASACSRQSRLAGCVYGALCSALGGMSSPPPPLQVACAASIFQRETANPGSRPCLIPGLSCFQRVVLTRHALHATFCMIAAGDLNSSSSAGSFLDADFDEDGGGASNSVQGVSCTAETIEAALTKAFHITGACRPGKAFEP